MTAPLFDPYERANEQFNHDDYPDNEDRYPDGGYELEQELSPKELALQAAIDANPGQEFYYFNELPTGEYVPAEPTPEMCAAESVTEEEAEPFLKRFFSGSQTRRNFTRKVATGGAIAAVGTFFLRTKHASAYQCWWQDDGLYACLANNCTQNNYRGRYKEQGYYCCNPSCHYTGSYRWTLMWCGC